MGGEERRNRRALKCREGQGEGLGKIKKELRLPFYSLADEAEWRASWWRCQVERTLTFSLFSVRADSRERSVLGLFACSSHGLNKISKGTLWFKKYWSPCWINSLAACPYKNWLAACLSFALRETLENGKANRAISFNVFDWPLVWKNVVLRRILYRRCNNENVSFLFLNENILDEKKILLQVRGWKVNFSIRPLNMHNSNTYANSWS